MLELTDMALARYGHLALGGGDSDRSATRLGERINQLHVKDVRNDVLAPLIADGAECRAGAEGFCELGR